MNEVLTDHSKYSQLLFLGPIPESKFKDNDYLPRRPLFVPLETIDNTTSKQITIGPLYTQDVSRGHILFNHLFDISAYLYEHYKGSRFYIMKNMAEFLESDSPVKKALIGWDYTLSEKEAESGSTFDNNYDLLEYRLEAEKLIKKESGDMFYPILTNSQQLSNGNIYLNQRSINTRTNTGIPLGVRLSKDMGRNGDKPRVVWEKAYIPELFIKYLEEYHEVLTGNTPSANEYILPLVIEPTNDQINNVSLSQQLSRINNEYKKYLMFSKVVSAKVIPNGRTGIQVRKITGSIITQDFESMRKHLSQWRDKEGTLIPRILKNPSHITRIFKFELGFDEKNKYPSMYNTRLDNEVLDLHDIVDVFMGQYTP